MKYYAAVNAEGHFYPYTVSYSKECTRRKFEAYVPPHAMRKRDRRKVRFVEVKLKEAA